MNIVNFKKKCIILSMAFLIIGAILTGAGWGMADFNPDNMREQGEPKWYRTFHVGEYGPWVGIRVKKGIYLITFGEAGDY